MDSSEYNISDFLINNCEISLAFHSLDAIPFNFSSEYSDVAKRIQKIDLTETGMKDLSFLTSLSNLDTLVLDKNEFKSIDVCPSVTSLQTLWFNNNKISNLPEFLDQVNAKFPKLRFLSLMRNPCCPGYLDLEDPDVEANRLNRLYILYRIPKLLMLDCAEITTQERKDAKVRGQYAVKRIIVEEEETKYLSSEGIMTAVSTEDSTGTDTAASNTSPMPWTMAPEYMTEQPRTYFRYDSNTTVKKDVPSEGNRFILNSQL